MTNKKMNPFLAFFRRNLGTLIGLAVLVVVVSFATPKFMTQSNMLNLFKANSVNAIISCGMLMAILMGEIDISVGSTVGLSACIAATTLTKLGFPIPVVVFLTILTGGVVGVINGFSISYLQVPAFVATLATQCIGRGLTEIITGGVTIRIRDDFYTALGNRTIGGVSITIIYAAVFALNIFVTQFLSRINLFFPDKVNFIGNISLLAVIFLVFYFCVAPVFFDLIPEGPPRLTFDNLQPMPQFSVYERLSSGSLSSIKGDPARDRFSFTDFYKAEVGKNAIVYSQVLAVSGSEKAKGDEWQQKNKPSPNVTVKKDDKKKKK